MSRPDDSAGFDVAIVTPTYISSNPRVVKEADALSAAGFRVCVVFAQGPMEWARADDDGVAGAAAWRTRPVRWSNAVRAERRSYLRSSLRFHLARRLPVAAWVPFFVTLRGECRTYPELSRAAAAVPAQLYVGHYPEGLAAAAYAARQRKAAVAYDAEDLHTEEDAPGADGLRRSARVFRIERRWIGSCAYVSTVSMGIARALARRYEGTDPLVVHNVFPWKARETLDGQVKDRRGPAVSLYWYSQVIGFDRGLEDAIRALGHIRRPFQLHLRGFHSDTTARQLYALAADVGIADRVFLHQRVPPAELLSRTAEHDIGLALEQRVSRSRELTVTNKLFFYLLAGLAVVASATPGQESVLQQMSGAGDTYPPGDPLALAGILDRLMVDKALLAARRRAALDAACRRWNWETEQRPLIETVRAVLDANVAGAEHRVPAPAYAASETAPLTLEEHGRAR